MKRLLVLLVFLFLSSIVNGKAISSTSTAQVMQHQSSIQMLYSDEVDSVVLDVAKDKALRNAGIKLTISIVFTFLIVFIEGFLYDDDWFFERNLEKMLTYVHIVLAVLLFVGIYFMVRYAQIYDAII